MFSHKTMFLAKWLNQKKMKKDSNGVVTLLIKSLKLGHYKMGLKTSVVQLLVVFTNHQPRYIFTYLVGVENFLNANLA
jgi:hypothetical protein